MLWGVEQAVHDAFVGIRGRVGKEGLQLLAGRRQADEVEINAAQEDVLPGRWQRGELGGGEAGVDEKIDWAG
ncbi:MAG: hypothetical protein EBS05_26525 [Proteobacteria bacterium]|nr:hypothetical protein [Pseudomonadota bacterium]